MRPAAPCLNRTQSKPILRLLLKISLRNTRHLAQPPRRPILSSVPSAFSCPLRRNARKLEAAFRFPAQGLYPSGSVGSAPGTLRRKLEPCERDHGADFRHHDSPDGLAFSVGSPPLHPKRLWADEGRCDAARLNARSEGCGKTIQRFRAD